MKKHYENPYQARYTQERMGLDEKPFHMIKFDKHPHGHHLSASKTEAEAWDIFNEIQAEETDLSKMNISNYGFMV